MGDTITESAEQSDGQARAPGQLLGSGIAGLFGLIYVEINAGPLPAPWPAALRIAAAVAAAGLAFVLVRLASSTVSARDEAEPGSQYGFGRRYWFIVAVEVAAIWAGSAVLSGPADLAHAVVAWVSVVVGVHFLALAALWRLRLMRYLGIAIAMCGLAGLAAAVATAPQAAVATAGGVLPGILLLAAGYGGAGGLFTGRPER